MAGGPLAGADLAFVGAGEIAQAVRSGARSAVAIARAHLDRIAAIDGRLGSFLTVDEAGALAAATAVDDKVRAGVDPGPLAGVPVGLKDNLVTLGLETTCASRILAGWVPPYDATAVARLRQAGAVILGKLNLDEFAMGSSTESGARGPCKNPWDPTRVAGGSSGGAAAAVAAGLCAIALGSDTGGSIRQPAAFTGCVGLKPTYGRVSRHGLVAYASSLDQIGPLARSAADCALALEVIAGHDPLDATCLPHAVPRYHDACAAAASQAPLERLRVGVPEALFAEGLDPDVAERVRAAIAALQQLGATVVPIALPHARYAIAAYYLIATAEASSNLARYDGVRYGLRASDTDLARMYEETRSAGFGDEVKRRIMLGTYALRAGYYDAYYLRAQKVRTLVRRDFDQAFASCDVVATPTSPAPAWRLGEKSADPLAMYLADVYTIACNLAGLPGLSVPCGFVERAGARLPVGLQLVGPALGEATLLHAASQYERSQPFAGERPPIADVAEARP